MDISDSKCRNDDILKRDGELNPDNAEEVKILVKTGENSSVNSLLDQKNPTKITIFEAINPT